MMDMWITARQAMPGERVKCKAGRTWTVIDQEPVDPGDPAAGTVVRCRMDDGIVQWFPLQAVFERVR